MAPLTFQYYFFTAVFCAHWSLTKKATEPDILSLGHGQELHLFSDTIADEVNCFEEKQGGISFTPGLLLFSFH